MREQTQTRARRQRPRTKEVPAREADATREMDTERGQPPQGKGIVRPLRGHPWPWGRAVGDGRAQVQTRGVGAHAGLEGASVLGGTGGHRAACLTREVGGDFHGLARSWVLADHLLEANPGDLDQVPCGEAALIPTDLVDGACRERDPVSRGVRKGQVLAGLRPAPPQAALCLRSARVPAARGGPPCLSPPEAPGSAGLRQQEPCLCLLLALGRRLCETLLWPAPLPMPPKRSSQAGQGWSVPAPLQLPQASPLGVC